MSAARLSIILATDRYDTIRGVIAALRRQHAPEILEIVIVMPRPGRDGIRHDELQPFANVIVVDVDQLLPLAHARALGIRAASAPFVFMGETHSYPQPGFAEAVLEKFEGPWAAIVPAILNANPARLCSWIAYIFDYAMWGPGRPSGVINDPLVYNTVYRRDLLLAFGDRLEVALDHFEDALWPHLHADGQHAWFARDAHVSHLNVATVYALFAERFAIGATLGARRAVLWPRSRRVLYALASPLIPFVLFARVLRRASREIPPGRRLGVIPGLFVSGVAKTMGELIGYLGVRLPAAEALGVHFEIHKVRYAGRIAP